MEPESGRTVRLFVRADSPIPDRRRRIVEQLQELSADGVIDSYRTELWPRGVSLDDYSDQPRDGVFETISTIEDWAEREGVAIRPPFDVRTQEWKVTGELDTKIRTPAMALAVFEAGALRQFYPHHDGEAVRTVAEGLAQLSESLEGVGANHEQEEVLEVNG